MFLKIDLDGVLCQFAIRDYRYFPPHRHYYDDEWCHVSLVLKSDWLNYSVDSELLLPCEVEELRDKLTQLLDGQMKDEETLEFVEPDLTFILYPSIKQADLRIAFWHDGLTANFLSVCLGERDLKNLLTYLRLIIGERNLLDDDVVQGILDGVIVQE